MAKRACIVRQGQYPYDLLVRREAEALVGDGFEVDVFCQQSSKDPAEETINRVHVHRLPIRLNREGIISYVTGYVWFLVLAAYRLAVLHLRHRYSIIQVNTPPDFLVFATLIPRLLGAKVGLVMYEPMPELWATLYHKRWVVRPLEIIQRLAIGYANVVFAVTQQQKETFVARGADADKIKVILNVPDARAWEHLVPQRADTGNDHFTLICHGRIEERYGHDTIVQAVNMVKDRIPNLRLRVLGNGYYVDEFLAQVKALGLEAHVQYLGWVSLQKMVEELCGADVGIVAQKSSPYSNLVHTGKMYDYLAFGKPVLASRLGAVRAYFDEGALYFFEPGDATSLAQGILDLWQHPEKRQALVEDSQRLYDQYRWEKQREIYLSAYHALLRL